MDVREVQEAFLEEVRPTSSGQRKGKKRPSVTEPTREQETLPFTEPATTVTCFSVPRDMLGFLQMFETTFPGGNLGRTQFSPLPDGNLGDPTGWGWSEVGPDHDSVAAQMRFYPALHTAVTGPSVHQARGPPGPMSCPQLPPSLVAGRI